MTANIMVSPPYQQFTLPNKFSAVFNGEVWCGVVDKDPLVPGNQVQIYVVNEDGSRTPVPQPIKLNQGGFLVYNGKPAKFVTDSNHSLLVRDRLKAKVWYEPNMAVMDPQTAILILGSQCREALRRSYAEAGYNLVDGSFELGGVLINDNDVLLHEASGIAYSGAPGVVQPGTDPVSPGFIDRSGSLSGNVTMSDMILIAKVGDIYNVSGTEWKRTSSTRKSIYDFTPLTAINIDSFGAVGDAREQDGGINPSPTNDTNAIQEAIKFAAIQGRCKVIASSGKAYRTDKIFVPTTYSAPVIITKQANEGLLIIDFEGAEFIGAGHLGLDNTFMEAAYFDNTGEMMPVIGTPAEAYLFAGYSLRNINIRSYYSGFKLRGWVYGCNVKNIHAHDVSQVIYAERCFYTAFKQIIHRGAYVNGLPIFHFHDNNNIMPMEALASGECSIGYRFTGATESIKMVSCGIEGFDTYGVQIDGEYNIEFDSCYFESHDGIGVTAKGGAVITFNNCWGYGPIRMLGDFGDNTNVRIRDNNVLGGGARWYDGLPAYNLSDFNLGTKGVSSGTIINKYVAPAASNVSQSITVYDPVIGPSRVYGKVEQTNSLHRQKVNGSYSEGFNSGSNGVGYKATQSTFSAGKQNVKYTTSISYSETQLIYVALRIDHAAGAWYWYGFISGSGDVTALHTTGEGDPVLINDSGMVSIESPFLSSTGNLGVRGGEIRLI